MVSAPWTLIAPLAVPGEDEGVYLWYGQAVGLSLNTQFWAGPLEKALSLKTWTVWVSSLPDGFLHVLSLDCECSYKVTYIVAFC